MQAEKLVRKYGRSLIGRIVRTQPFGGWSGGDCEVVDLGDDPSAPEIVMNVRRLSDDEEIGMFEDEEVELRTATPYFNPGGRFEIVYGTTDDSGGVSVWWYELEDQRGTLVSGSFLAAPRTAVAICRSILQAAGGRGEPQRDDDVAERHEEREGG